jgi:hypothetical protein
LNNGAQPSYEASLSNKNNEDVAMDKKAILAKLPPEARKKLAALTRKADAAYAELRGLGDLRREAIEGLSNFRRDRSHRKSEEDKIIAAHHDAREAELDANAAHFQSVIDEASEKSAPVRMLVQRCLDWSEAVFRAESKIVAVEVAQLKVSAADIPMAVAACRKKLGEIEKNIDVVERAPVPAGELKRRARAALKVVAERGRPHLSGIEREADPFGVSDMLGLTSMVAAPSGVGMGTLTQGSAEFLAWVLQDLLAEKLSKIIDEVPQEGALDDAARDKKMMKLVEQKLEIEREEEALISLAEKTGTPIQRRPDADIRAVLCVMDS